MTSDSLIGLKVQWKDNSFSCVLFGGQGKKEVAYVLMCIKLTVI